MKSLDEVEDRVESLHSTTVVVNTYGGPYTSANVLRKFRGGNWNQDKQRFQAGNPPYVGNVLVPEMKKGGVDIILGGYSDIHDHAIWIKDVRECDSVAEFVTTVGSMKGAKEAGKIGIQIILHGPRTIESGLEMLSIHRMLGATVFTLCSSYRNEIVDGCREPGNAGLSIYGAQVVAELNAQKIAVDVSHISERGFWDVLEQSSVPPILTHTAAKSITESPRNMSDEQLKAHAEAGGYIGVVFFPAYLAEKNATIEHLLDHIDYISKLVGVEFVGLGADFCTYGWEWVSQVWERSAMPERRYCFPKHIENITKWKNVTRGLIRRGYKDDEISGILGHNYLRIIDDIIS